MRDFTALAEGCHRLTHKLSTVIHPNGTRIAYTEDEIGNALLKAAYAMIGLGEAQRLAVEFHRMGQPAEALQQTLQGRCTPDVLAAALRLHRDETLIRGWREQGR